MKVLQAFFLLINFGVYSQSYNSYSIVRDEILLLDQSDNFKNLEFIEFYSDYGGDRFYLIDEYRMKPNKSNNHVIGNKYSTYVFSKEGRLLLSRVGEKSASYTKTGKDSINIIKKPAGATYKKLFFYDKLDTLKEIRESVKLNDSMYVYNEYTINYPDSFTKTEKKHVKDSSENIPEKLKPYFLSEWEIITKYTKNNSYKSTRKTNGKKDNWFQEKRFNKNGYLIWENEYLLSSVAYIYDDSNRLIKKIINHPYYKNNKQIYHYQYDEFNNRNKLLIEFFNYSTELFSKLIMNVEYIYVNEKGDWKDLRIELKNYKIADNKEEIVESDNYKVIRDLLKNE